MNTTLSPNVLAACAWCGGGPNGIIKTGRDANNGYHAPWCPTTTPNSPLVTGPGTWHAQAQVNAAWALRNANPTRPAYDIGNQLGLNPSTVAGWLAGKRLPTTP